MFRDCIAGMILMLVASISASSAEPLVLPLWPAVMPGPAVPTPADTPPREPRLVAGQPITIRTHVAQPRVEVFQPSADRRHGGAVVICPGGGFSGLAWDLEGTEVAEWFVQRGYTAAVLAYRVPTRQLGNDVPADGLLPAKSVGPVMDAQRAVSMLRQRAADFGIDARRIGIVGFSAGGETAALTSVLERRLYPPGDESDAASCRPDFAVLIYPGGLRDRETGRLNPWLGDLTAAPPTCIVMTQDDRVGVQHATTYFDALTTAKVPAELHLFERGGHGYGMRPTEVPATHWPNRLARWLRDRGYSSPEAPPWDAAATPRGSPANHLPPWIRQIVNFGERPEFSHDGRRILFLSKQFGDVMELDIGTGRIHCLTNTFPHFGYNRAVYLWNGDVLLTGPAATFDQTDREERLQARRSAMMSVLRRTTSGPPIPLGAVAEEGPAVSRRSPRLAWTHDGEDGSVQTAISTGRISYEDGRPCLADRGLVLTVKDFPASGRPLMIETQNLVPPADDRLTISAYRLDGGNDTEGYVFDFASRQLTNFTRSPEHYEEIEGIFPDGGSTLVERALSAGKPWPGADTWRVWLDGSRPPERLTWFTDYKGFKATNQVVSDDGRLIAFQIGRTGQGDEAGVGYGLFLLDLERYHAARGATP